MDWEKAAFISGALLLAALLLPGLVVVVVLPLFSWWRLAIEAMCKVLRNK